jgi:hypothetical protein
MLTFVVHLDGRPRGTLRRRRGLRRIGRGLWCEAEQDPVKAPPLKYVKMSHDYLTRLLTAASLAIAR